MGDGFLVEFPSAVEAVECAIQAQKDVRSFSEKKGPEDKISIRIGIHVGDVVHSDGDILGTRSTSPRGSSPSRSPAGSASLGRWWTRSRGRSTASS